VIRRSAGLARFLLVVFTGFAVVPAYYVQRIMGDFALALAPAAAVVFTEWVWRERFRAGIWWSREGILLVEAFKSKHLTWPEVRHVSRRFNVIEFETTSGLLQWETDLPWLLGWRLRARSRSLDEKIISLGRAIKSRGGYADDDASLVPYVPARRPVLVYVVSASVALILAVLTLQPPWLAAMG
jgi:hypothetical protein